MFALGLLSWMYSRPTEGTLEFVRQKFAAKPGDRRGQHHRVQARAGTSARPPRRSRSAYEVKPAPLPPGTYRNISGNLALAYGLIAASQRSGLPLFLGAYPITPASDILHELSKHKRFGVRTFQAEDEIAGIGAALGAAFGGCAGGHHIVRAGHRAQGRDDRAGRVARAAADHLRHPARRPVHRPADQDRAVRPAAGDVRTQRRGAGADRRAAVARRLLRRRDRGGPDRAHLPHAGVPALRRLPGQRLRAVASPAGRRACPTSTVEFATAPNGTGEAGRRRSCRTCATRRRWPGRGRCRARPGLEHRIGGIEKADRTGNISYDPDNHDFMVRTRQAKVDGIARSLPATGGRRPRKRSGDARVLVLGWGSTYGPIGAACRQVRAAGAPSPRRTCGTSTRSRADLGESWRATTRSSSRR